MKVLNQQLLQSRLSELANMLRESADPQKEHVDYQRFLSELIELCQLNGGVPKTEYTSVLISDLRGFTVMLEKSTSHAVIEILNLYFIRMIAIVHKYGGLVDKLIGDSVMALFPVPESGEHKLAPVLNCAIDMQLAMDEINAICQERGLDRLYMGIGINTGDVITSVLGSNIYSEYTVIGSHVNLASRIEAYSLRGQILLSEDTYQLAKDFIIQGKVDKVNMKGMRDPLTIYEMTGIRFPELKNLPVRETRSSPRVPVNFPFRFQQVQGAEVLPKYIKAMARDLSYGGSLITTKEKLDVGDNIKINVPANLLGFRSSVIYAKVTSCRKIETGGYEEGLEFTVIDDAAVDAIHMYVSTIL